MKLRPVPTEGIIGTTALREAKAGEFSQVSALINDALRKSYPNHYLYACAFYADRVIVNHDSRLWAYPYTLSDTNQVTIGAPTEVVLEHISVALREALNDNPAGGGGEGNGVGEDHPGAGCFIEAIASKDGEPKNRYLVRVIKAGLSGNKINYSASVLREAAPLFNGARVFAKSDLEHNQGGGKDVRQIIGRLVESRFVEAKGGGELQAVLEVLESSAMSATLRESVERGMSDDLFGLSIDAKGISKQKGRFREAVSIDKVASVDLIVEPGAGGQIIRFVEAMQENDTMLRQQMLTAIAKRNRALATKLENATDEEVLTHYTEAMAQPERNQVDPTEIETRLVTIEARSHARAVLAGSKLPKATVDRLNTNFRESASLTVEDVDTAIKTETDYLTTLREAGKVTGLGEPRVEAGEDRSEKVSKMFDDFFDPTKRVMSFRECYINVTGDRDVTGLMQNCDKSLMREALGGENFREAISAATFSDILGSAITRAMLRDYGALEAYQDWRFLVDVVPVRDFRTNERTRMGGYGNLPAVAENGSYDALTSPGDDKATYAVSKRGGTETISLETIANDDVGVLRRIPTSLARAAGRTLYEFVFDFLKDNAAIYDAVALFHGAHANLGTAALAAATYAASRLRMKRQVELTSNKRLGITARHLIVPGDLEEAAFDMFVRNTNNDETFVQSRKPTVHVVDYWTDANNWYVTADRADVPMIELGFYGGSEEPEIFVQDNPTQGSLFSNDQIKYKIRHVYGGAVTDFRGLDGNVVA